MPTMLIVDDNLATVMLIRSILPTQVGWQVLTATDGKQGANLIRQQHASLDVVLLDIYLPGMDGREVYQQIHAFAPTLPIIGISGDTGALMELATLGCYAILPKPLRRMDLLATLERALQARDRTLITHTDVTDNSSGFDRRIVPKAHLEDLNLSAVEHHIMNAITHREYDGPTDPINFLLKYEGAVYIDGVVVPTYAGLLTFAPHPEAWISGCGVDIAQFITDVPTVETMGFRQTIRGPIPQMITQVLDVLWALITHRHRIVDNVERIEEHAYPRLVLRELTLNALCHRDWSLTGSTIQIRVFPSRIDWVTPGGLPTGVTVETLCDAQVSRNSTLTQLLYQAGYVEQFGLGMDMVYQMLTTHGFVSPSAHNRSGWFMFSIFNEQTTLSANHHVEDTVWRHHHLPRRQQQIIGILSIHGTLLAHEVAELLDLSLRSVQRDLTLLVNQGVLVAIGATRSRRYRYVSASSPD